MAKKAWLERNKRKTETVKKFAAIRAEMKAKRDYAGLAKLPRDASPTRIVNRCAFTGRRRGYLEGLKTANLEPAEDLVVAATGYTVEEGIRCCRELLGRRNRGAGFTAIAVAHTLYAPREVVLWNGRRIVLLGTSLAIATGAQFSMVVVVPVALVFLLYVAPVRRQAGVVIWLAASGVGFVLLFAAYFFHPHAFAESMRHAAFWGATWRAFAIPGVYRQVAAQLGRSCPAFALALPVALVAYALWPRTRYFGNTAPLSVALLFLVLGMAHPHLGGSGFLLAAVPFLFLFVAGVLADLMETRFRSVVTAGILGLLAANTLWSLIALGRVGQG